MYTKLGHIRIDRIDNPNYTGTAGDKTILLYKCKCGSMQPFDYGATPKMRDTYRMMLETSKNDSAPHPR